MGYLTPSTLAQLAAQLKRQEQSNECALTAYICPAGHVTLGWGRNLERDLSPEEAKARRAELLASTCTREQADQWLAQDIFQAESELLTRWPWLVNLDQVRLAVLVNLAYNMGLGKLAGFVKMRAALRAGRLFDAAAELKSSLWYSQVGDRGPELVAQLKTGEWQEPA